MHRQYFEAESHVSTYDKFRPRPPRSLISRIVEFTQEKISGPLNLAIDIGCGSGQSTQMLGLHFNKVLGLDPSASIVAEANRKGHPNVSYIQSSAEKIDVKDNSGDLITACQAVHWFNLPEFYKEADRILRKNGVLAMYGYRLPIPIYGNQTDELAELVKKYYKEVIGDYIYAESKEVYLENYKAAKFNEVYFVEGQKMKREEGFVAEIEATVEDIAGYISSWSGFQNFKRQKGLEESQNVLKNFERDLYTILGKDFVAGSKLKIKYEYFLLIGRKN